MTAQLIEAIEIPVDADVLLRGQVWVGSDAWVILLHDTAAEEDDLDQWSPLAPILVARGWSVLAIDLRGHGASDGAKDPMTLTDDLGKIAGVARAKGAKVLAIVAAGMSAIAVLASTSEIRPDALVLLSPTIEGNEQIESLRGSGEAKLLIVGGGDPEARATGERVCKAAIGWVLLATLPTGDQGTAILAGPAGAHAREQILGFLTEQRYLAKLRKRGVRAIPIQGSKHA